MTRISPSDAFSTDPAVCTPIPGSADVEPSSDRLRTHARTIVEGEGAEDFSPALVEAVAEYLWGWDAQTQMFRTWKSELPGMRAHYTMRARGVLDAIRKHQAGE